MERLWSSLMTWNQPVGPMDHSSEHSRGRSHRVTNRKSRLECAELAAQPRLRSCDPPWPGRSLRVTPGQHRAQSRFRVRDPLWPISSRMINVEEAQRLFSQQTSLPRLCIFGVLTNGLLYQSRCISQPRPILSQPIPILWTYTSFISLDLFYQPRAILSTETYFLSS